MPTTVSVKGKLVVTTVEILAQMRGRFVLVTISCILPLLPIIHVDVHIIIINTQVVNLHIHVIPKLVPLTIFQIGCGTNITMIDIALYVLGIFRTPKVVLRDTCYGKTCIMKKLKFESSFLVKIIIVANKKHVNEKQ